MGILRFVFFAATLVSVSWGSEFLGVQYSTKFTFRKGESLVTPLRRIKILFEEHEWERAFAALEAIEKFSPEKSLVRPKDILGQGSEDLYWSAKQVLRFILASLPEEGLKIYRARNEGAAARRLQAAKALPEDRSQLDSVTQKYPLTRAGAEALELQAGRAFSNGDFADAQYWYQSLWHPETSPLTLRYAAIDLPDSDRARIYALYLLAGVANGDAGDAAVQKLKDQFPEDFEMHFAGRKGALLDSFSTAVAEDGLDAMAALKPWDSFAGDSSGNRAVAFDVNETYRVSHLQIPRALRPPPGGEFDQGGYPVILGNAAWVGYRDRVIRFDLTQFPLGKYVAGAKVFARPESPAVFGPESERTGDSLPVQVPLAVSGNTVIAKIWDDEIVALDATAVGKVRWRVTADAIGKGLHAGKVDARIRFSAPPTVSGEFAYVTLKFTDYQKTMFPVDGDLESYIRSRTFYVAALRVRDGSVAWLKDVSSYDLTQSDASNPRGTLYPERWPVDEHGDDRQMLAVHHRKVFFQSNFGTLAALDSDSGEILWLVDYTERRAKISYWVAPLFSAPVAHGLQVAFLPLDSGDVTLRNTETGESISNPDFFKGGHGICGRVQGWAREKLFVVGEPMAAIYSDRFVAAQDNDEISDKTFCAPRGLLTQHHYVWMKRKGVEQNSKAVLKAISLETGASFSVNLEGVKGFELPIAAPMVPLAPGRYFAIGKDDAVFITSILVHKPIAAPNELFVRFMNHLVQ